MTLARFGGLVYAMFGGWVLIVNVIDHSNPGWTLAWVLTSGFFGALGGILFLLSFDGPDRLRSRRVRLLGWLGMLVLGILPWSYWFLTLPIVLLTIGGARRVLPPCASPFGPGEVHSAQ